MHVSLFSISALALLPLASFVSAQNVTVLDPKITPCPFNLQVSPSANFGTNGSYIDITYSTKGTTPNSLVSYGPASTTKQRRCYALAYIHHPNVFARARPLWMEMSGSVKLDAGLTAKVETGLVWGAMMAMTNFSTLTLTGPTSSPTFSQQLNITNRAHATSCEYSLYGSRSDPTTLAKYTEPHLSSLFTISGTGTGTGTLGEEADLKHRIYLEWIDGCGSYSQWYDCLRYDRFDNPIYYYKTNSSTCTDFTRPPPTSMRT